MKLRCLFSWGRLMTISICFTKLPSMHLLRTSKSDFRISLADVVPWLNLSIYTYIGSLANMYIKIFCHTCSLKQTAYNIMGIKFRGLIFRGGPSLIYFLVKFLHAAWKYKNNCVIELRLMSSFSISSSVSLQRHLGGSWRRGAHNLQRQSG